MNAALKGLPAQWSTPQFFMEAAGPATVMIRWEDEVGSDAGGDCCNRPQGTEG